MARANGNTVWRRRDGTAKSPRPDVEVCPCGPYLVGAEQGQTSQRRPSPRSLQRPRCERTTIPFAFATPGQFLAPVLPRSGLGKLPRNKSVPDPIHPVPRQPVPAFFAVTSFQGTNRFTALFLPLGHAARGVPSGAARVVASGSLGVSSVMAISLKPRSRAFRFSLASLRPLCVESELRWRVELP